VTVALEPNPVLLQQSKVIKLGVLEFSWLYHHCSFSYFYVILCLQAPRQQSYIAASVRGGGGGGGKNFKIPGARPHRFRAEMKRNLLMLMNLCKERSTTQIGAALARRRFAPPETSFLLFTKSKVKLYNGIIRVRFLISIARYIVKMLINNFKKKISQCGHFKTPIFNIYPPSGGRVVISVLLYFGIVSFLSDTEIGIHSDLFHFTPLGSSLAVFHARRIVQPIFPYNRFEPQKGLFSKGYVKAYKNAVMGIDAPQFL